MRFNKTERPIFGLNINSSQQNIKNHSFTMKINDQVVFFLQKLDYGFREVQNSLTGEKF